MLRGHAATHRDCGDGTLGGFVSGVDYAHSRTAPRRFRLELDSLIDAGATRFCDIGGGANPIVPIERVEAAGLEYAVADSSADELDKAPAGYRLAELDIADRAAVTAFAAERGRFDVVLSKWTAEHLPDGAAFHSHVFELLEPGGTAVHLFPTLYSPVFALNRVLPDGISEALLSRVGGGREAEGTHGKFRPYYSWCRGPSRRGIRRFEGLGYSVETYVGFFGHGYYKRVSPLQRVHDALTDQLLRRPMPALTSYALVTLRRPGPSAPAFSPA